VYATCSTNSNFNISMYPCPCALHISANNMSPDFHPTATSCLHSTSINVRGTCRIQLLKHVLALLNNPPVHSIAFIFDKLWPCTSLLVANTGAADHMIMDKSAFISYHPVTSCRTRMGNHFGPNLWHRLGYHLPQR
jgi:hypothetical protein